MLRSQIWISLFYIWNIPSLTWRVDSNYAKRQINIGILLPQNDVPLSNEPCFGAKHLQLYSNISQRRTSQIFSYPGTPVSSIRMWFVDSNCSDIHGPLNAMELKHHVEVHAFYGPCCKYVLAPVGRYAKVWGIPIITPGGLTTAFSHKKNFPLLTRIMAPYEKLAHVIISMLQSFNWTQYGLLWHDHHLSKWMGQSECNQIADALIRITRLHRWFHEPYKESFDEGYIQLFDWDTMLYGMGNNSRGNFDYLPV